jgi:hypothetical protein
MFIPVDNIHNTNTDCEEVLLSREFLEIECIGGKLLYNEISKSTVKKCVLVLIICIIGHEQTAL